MQSRSRLASDEHRYVLRMRVDATRYKDATQIILAWAKARTLSNRVQLEPVFDFFRKEKIIAMLVALNLCLSIWLAATLNIWVDEAHTLDTTARGIDYAISRALYYEAQPPLYFVILACWRSINQSIFFARLFSILCIVFSIFAAVKLSKRFLPKIHSAWIVALVAFHPYTIWAAIEVRAYAFATLLAVLLQLTFFDGYLSKKPSKVARWFYVFLTLSALYTHYFLACLLLTNGCILLILRRWRCLIDYILSMLVVALCFIPMLLPIYNQVVAKGQVYGDIATPFLTSLRLAWFTVLRYAVPTYWGNDAISSAIARWLRYGGLAILIWTAYRNRRNLNYGSAIALSSTLIAILTIAVIFTVTDTASVAYRYSYPVFILAIITVLAIISLVPTSRRRLHLVVWTAIMLLLCLMSLYVTYKPLAKEGDWQRVASYIMAFEKANQPILVFVADSALPLKYYYFGHNVMAPIPRAVGENYDIRDFALKDEKEIQAVLSRFSIDRQSLWVVTNYQTGKCETSAQLTFFDINLNCQVLEEFINQHYSVQLSQDFYKSSVRLLNPG